MTLQVRDVNRLLPEADTSRVLEQGTLTIGRGLENDWVLPDPERVISKQHCEIQAQNSGFLLTDTSSNGVFLNATAVGRGKSVTLNDGDQIRISHFEFTVSLAGDQAALSGQSDGTSDAYAASDPSVFPDDHAAGGDDPLAGILGDDDHSDPFGTPAPQAAPPALPDNDFLIDAPPETRESAGSAMPLDHVSAGQGLLQVPDLQSEIPSDWDDEFAGDDSSAGARPAWPEEADPFAASGPAAATGPALAAEPALPVTPPAAPTPPPASAPQAPLPTGGPTQASVNGLKAFLAGAGLEELEIPDERAEATLKILGTLYRNSVQGLMEVLATRSSIKNEFRLSQTTIQPVENNPLKFSLGVDDAMTALLTKRNRGYMPPVEAIDEAFDDIKAHQVAVLAGMQVALTGLLARFDPKTLEERMAADKGIAKLLTGKKARYWDEFTKLYEKLAMEAEDDFHSVFGREFGRAYEEQVRKHDRRGD